MLTDIAAVQDQVQTIWAPVFMNELREQLLLGAMVNKDYQGEIKKLNDTVKVSQIVAPKGKLRTVGVDADSFETETLSTLQIDIKADKRATAAFEFEDIVGIQSQIGQQDSELRASLLYAVQKQINDYLYSIVAPSAASPTHIISGVTDFNAGQVSSLRKLAGQAKWLKNKPWYLLADPSYHKDLLDAQTLVSSDNVGSDQPTISGQIGSNRFGFSIFEDNSEGLADLGVSGEDAAIAFHPDFMHLVMQTEPQFKISDLHSQKRFGYVMSVDLIFGSKMGIAGGDKVIKVTA